MASDTADLDYMQDGLYPSFGWVDDQAEVQKIQATLPFQTLGDTPLGSVSISELPTEWLGWRIWKAASRSEYPDLAQGPVGLCCGFGAVKALMILMASEILNGDNEGIRIPSPEITYAVSRVNVMGWGGWQDGSTGAAVGKALRDFGAAPMEVVEGVDLSKYDPQRGRTYGARGIPKALFPFMAQHKVAEITRVSNFDDYCRAMAGTGSGVILASSIGFNGRRDADGVIKASGRWNHCMTGMGFRLGRRPGGFIDNHWTKNYHTGGLSHPDMPKTGFWADADDMDRILRQGDSWALAGLSGFQPKKPIF